MNKVAIYVRQSNHPNAEQALEKQKTAVADYCNANGFEICDAVGSIGDRQQGFSQFIDMVKNAKEKGISKVVMQSTNRLVATKEEYILLQEELAKEGVDLKQLGIEIVTIDGTHNGLQYSCLVGEFLMNANLDEND